MSGQSGLWTGSPWRGGAWRGHNQIFPIFQLGEASSISLERGVGDATFTCSSTCTVVDHEGIIRTMPPNCALRPGARFSCNLFRDDILGALSEDNTTGGIAQSSNAAATDAVTVTSTAGGWYWYRAVANPGWEVANRTYRARVVVSDMGSVAQFGFRIAGSGGAADDGVVSITAPGTYSVLTTFSVSSGNVIDCGIDGRSVAGIGGDDTTYGSIVISYWQLEDVTGQANQNPSEYVSVGVLSAPYHGLNADGIKAFDYANGNTVDGSGVVTEAAGAVISPAPMWGHEPSSTNKCTNYNLNPTATTNVTKGGDAAATLSVVIPGTVIPAKYRQISNGAVFLLDNSGGSAEATATIGGTTGNTNPHSAKIAALCDGGSNELRLASTKIADITAASWADIEAVNLTPGATTDKLVVVAAAGRKVWFFANQLEELTKCSALIKINGVSVARAAQTHQYQIAGNIDPDEGSLVFKGFVPGFSNSDLPATGYPAFSLISLDGGADNLLWYQRSSGDTGLFYTYDDTKYRTLTPTLVEGEKYNIVVEWSVTQNLFYIGVRHITGSFVWGASTTFTGYNSGSVIGLFLTGTFKAQAKYEDVIAFSRMLGQNYMEANY